MTSDRLGYRLCRTIRSSLILVILLLLSMAMPAAAASPAGPWHVPGPVTKLYIGQSARLTARIPATWTVPPDDDAIDDAGPTGFVASRPLAAPNLASACAQASVNATHPLPTQGT